MILRAAKSIARRVLPAPAFERLKMLQRRLHFSRASGFSDEEPVIARHLASLAPAERYCVDIAAQDGIGGSQTLGLFKQGWRGLAVECDPKMFAILAGFYAAFEDVGLARAKVTPPSVCGLLRAHGCPKNFGFLSLDIDSYDFYVLRQLLSEFRPSLICVEINEMIPPPIRFAVRFDPHHQWDGSHYQGQSISKCYELCAEFDYQILELHYNNLMLVPRELNRQRGLSPEEAYDAGYRNKPDRTEKFPWNADVDAVLSMSKGDAIAFLRRLFAAHDGRYDLD